MEIKIVIPSHKRADRISTTRVIDHAIICVPESQKDIYIEANPNNEIVTHPDSVIGLAAKRQWIYEHFKNVFMLDDDITLFKKMYTAEKENYRVSKKQAYDIVQNAGNIAKLTGCYLFGFNKNPNVMMYKPFAPFKMSGYATGCAFGLLEGSAIQFTTKTIAVEDFFISGLNAYHHRKAFFDMRFNFVQKDTFTNLGGLADFRTSETEKNDTLFLRRMFGSAIRLKNDTASARNKNPYGRTIKITY